MASSRSAAQPTNPTGDSGEARVAEVAAAQARVINVVNTFYRDKLTGMPTIDDYITGIQTVVTT